MKNPHGVEPTRYMKKKDSSCAIDCESCCGPRFGYEMHIDDECNEEDSCDINCLGDIMGSQFEYHPEYISSLYVGTADPDEENHFSVLDYEVFGIDFENRDNIYKICKHPDIIWEYIETKDISEESLKQIDDDRELLTDLDTINCDDNSLRLKVSRSCLKNPSEFLPDTQLVDKKYDSYLKEWAGDYNMKLIYRSSEHGYTAESFHEFCDDKGPTLIVIKSIDGWIFGGYTTQSWSGDGIYLIYDI